MYTDALGDVFCTLIVEDNKDFGNALGETLSAHFPGMEVDSALDGEIAIKKIRAREPDIILMDVRLPGVNGIALTRRLKSSGNQSVIVVLSTYDLDEYRQAAINNGADCFISKVDPSFTPNLLAQVRKAWNSRPTPGDRGGSQKVCHA